MRKILREPLLHFLLLGALLFVAYRWVDGEGSRAPDQIVVPADRVRGLADQFRRTWQRPPTQQELDSLIQTFVREEVMYREGVTRGLDRDDPIIRRRVQQKLEFITDGSVPSAPSDAELQAWVDAHPDLYAMPPRYTLRQIYFDPGRHDDMTALIAQARANLAAGRPAGGDSISLPAELTDAETSDIERQFGVEFAHGLAALPVGSWQGPIPSGFGVHLVQIQARGEARAPNLADIREAAERDWLHDRSQKSQEAFYQQLLKRYTVTIESDVATIDGAIATAHAR
jgi:parvulin-like peptidyl-prolyl isomerase